MTPGAGPRLNAQIYDEAAAWLLDCRSEVLDPGVRREFDHWLRKSPAHLAAYLELAAVWNEGEALDASRRWDAETLIAQARQDSAAIIEWPQTGRSVAVTGASESGSTRAERAPHGPGVVRKPRISRRALAASLAALALGLGILLHGWPLRSATYVTDTGEQRSFALEDGSVVDMNAGSRLRVHLGEHQRCVELLEGEALFHVAKDPSRPFLVRSDGAQVRAVGTQFDVNRRHSGTIVTVLEGRVAVTEAGAVSEPIPAAPAGGAGLSPQEETSARAAAASRGALLLGAGDQATVTARRIEQEARPDLGRAMAWTQRRLVFEAASLADVAEEFNRYNRRKLVLTDPALDDFHVSGMFASTDPTALVSFLRARPGLTVLETDAEIRIGRNPATKW